MAVLQMIIAGAHIVLITLILLPLLSQKISLWWLDNLINFQLQWTALAIVLIISGVKYSQQFIIPISLLYIAIIVYNFSFLYKQETVKPQHKETLKIAQINIQYGNPSIEYLIDELKQSDYDVIVLQEIGDDEHKKIRKLIKQYPYSVGSSLLEDFTSGIAVFSRWPIVTKKIHDLGYVESNVIEITIQSPEQYIPIQLFALHPASPRNKTLWLLRNLTLEFVAMRVSTTLYKYSIVIGDMNISPWSPKFKNLLDNSNLINSANGFGYIPSWAHNTSNILTRVSSSAYIDHCLISHSFNVLNKEFQHIDGSDHVLISTELGIE